MRPLRRRRTRSTRLWPGRKKEGQTNLSLFDLGRDSETCCPGSSFIYNRLVPNQYHQRDPRDRFWEKVNRDGPIMPRMETPCWQWTGYLNEDGYGRFRMGGVKARRPGAHVFAWELENGPVPRNFKIDHACRNPACVRVSHLRLTSNKENGENQSAAAHSNNFSSRYRGVTRRKKDGRWVIAVKHHGKKYFNGSYATEEEAAVAVRELRNRLHTHNDVDRED